MLPQTPPATELPGILKFAVWLTFFNTWVLFEETVVDRYGLWEYMPYYRVGRLCSWDIGAMALLGFGVWHRLFAVVVRPGPSSLSFGAATKLNVPPSVSATGARFTTSRSMAGAYIFRTRPIRTRSASSVSCWDGER